MKYTINISLAVLLWSFNPSLLFADDHSLPAFSAKYEVYLNGMHTGETERTFSRSDSNSNMYTYRSETRTTGLVALFHKDVIIEQSRMNYDQHKIRPVKYTYERTGGKKEKNIKVDFDWHNQKITNIVNETTMQFKLEPDILDKLMYQYVIMQDIKNNRLPFSYPIVSGRKIKVYDFRILGEETIETPLGKFNTVKIERVRKDNDSEEKTYLWCAHKLNYLPVKLENIDEDKDTTVAVIKAVTGFDY